MKPWLYNLFRVMRPVFGLYWRFRIRGIEKLPVEGGAIVVANHESFLDPWYLIVMFPRTIRFLITRQWYYGRQSWRWFFDGHGVLPVQENAEATMAAVCELLAKGEVVGVFPEGRISKDGRLGRFRAGVAHMAALSGAPVIPVGIRGAFESLPRQRRFPKPGAITLEIGEPLRFPGAPLAEPPPMREILAFRDRLFDEICELVGQQDSSWRKSPSPVADRAT